MGNLHHLHIKGFKSIRDQRLDFGNLNIFIGGNGVGKSNLIGVFHFLNRVVNQELQVYTGEAGGANNLLHFGRKKTDELSLEIEFREGSGANSYRFMLKPTDDDRFIIRKESTVSQNLKKPSPPNHNDSWTGHAEAHVGLSKKAVAKQVRKHLDSYRIYHFHDTSTSSRVKQTCDVSDNRLLRPDAGNLAAFLYYLQQARPDHFQNIQDSIRLISPFFDCFKLAPSELNPEKIRLEWQEKGSDAYFNASSLSDGTLRFMCLATLLLQPQLPSLILIDEPELGLHPAAIQQLTGFLESASAKTQIIVATQSVTLVNQFSPEMVWVVDREDGQSVFRHLSEANMETWLEDYSLGDLWEKNIIGGRP